jgi:hypothetical protein
MLTLVIGRGNGVAAGQRLKDEKYCGGGTEFAAQE